MPIRISAHSRSPPHNRDHHINHRRLHIAVAQEFLNRPDVVAGLQQVRCETMSQGVWAKLKQLGKIEMKEIENGITQMTIGGTFKTQKEAFELNKKVIMAGQSDAFVAVYYFGKRTYMINLEKKGIFNVK